MGVNVSLTRDEDGRYTVDLGSAALPTITWNPLELAPEVRKEEHMGARLLLAAALACFVNTMAGDLANGGASRVAEIRAEGGIEKERDTQLRTRFTQMEINVETEVADEDRAVFETVRNSLLNGSLVTYTLEEETDVDYNIEAV